MKIYERIKDGEKRCSKLFGITIMEQDTDYNTSERWQSFLGGVVTTKRLNNVYDYKTYKTTKIFGKAFLERYEENNIRTHYLFGKKIRETSLIDEFKKKYIKYFDKQYDDIYILHANSGEVYLTLVYVIDTFIKKNGSKKPLLVATKPYHVEMIKMICPDIPYIYMEELVPKFVGNSFIIDNFRFFLLYSNAHFKHVEIDIKSHKAGEYHYFYEILKKLEITKEELSYRHVTVSEEDKNNMLTKIKTTGLNLDNFVFLAPEAKSCKMLDEDFWVMLINEFQKQGVDVFVNIMGSEMKLWGAKDYKTCKLNFAEAYFLASMSKKIVSLRSGFSELLLQTNVPEYVLYTKFNNRQFIDDMDVTHVMSGFNLHQLPFVNKKNIIDINTYEISLKNSIDKILKKI